MSQIRMKLKIGMMHCYTKHHWKTIMKDSSEEILLIRKMSSSINKIEEVNSLTFTYLV